jgi:uncharacterized protein
MVQHAIHWFEIMASDFERAVKFYETALGVTLQRQELMGGKMAIFPAQPAGSPDAVRGAIWHDATAKPSLDGTCIYLNAEGRLPEILARIPKAGGKVLMPITSIGPSGFIALFTDTEGNRVGLHSSTAAA